MPFGWSTFVPVPGDAPLGIHLPKPVPGDLFDLLAEPAGWKYFAVILPMGLFNVIGSLQNLESAEAAGDKFPTRPSLLANGAGSIIALGQTFDIRQATGMATRTLIQSIRLHRARALLQNSRASIGEVAAAAVLRSSGRKPAAARRS